MIRFQEEYKKLNENQKKAVDTLDGPIMVVAGPGTGKTQVLALRIVNILRQNKADAGEILALTFSDRAAVEMQKRLASFLGSISYDISIKTFHGFCNDIIQENPEKFMVTKDLSAIDELDKIKTIKKIIKKTTLIHLKPYFDQFYYRKDILAKIGILKKEGISPDDFHRSLVRWQKGLESEKTINKRTGKPPVTWRNSLKDLEKCQDLLKIYRAYVEDASKKGWYDFDDMIVWVTSKLKSDEELREEYQQRFKFILADEYQDTNSSQNEVIELLAASRENPNIFVVGDDDQSIYRFQGANLENILSFEKTYPGALIIPITINYRSNQNIIDISQSVIEKNENRLVNESKQNITKDLQAFRKEEEGKVLPELYEFSSVSVEDYFIAEKIKELKKAGIPYKEMAVLCRTNQDVSDIADYLIKADIPVEMASSGSVLDVPAVAGLIILGETVNDPGNDFMLYRAMSAEVWDIEPKDFLQFTYLAGRKRMPLYSFWKKGAIKKETFSDYHKIERFFEQVVSWKKASATSPALIMFSRLLDESGMLKDYLAAHDIRSLNCLSALFSFIKQAQRRRPELNLVDALADLKAMKEEGIAIKERQLSMAEDDVRILTAHNAKGSEFAAVFIPRLYHGGWDGKRTRDLIKLPGNLIANQRMPADGKEEDERRLFFVALTRAKSRLFLARSQAYELSGSAREKAPSKFLTEIAPDLLRAGDATPYENNTIRRTAVELRKRDDSKHAASAEEIFLKERVSDLSLSPTSLNVYLDCPLKYKYEKLLMVPAAKTKTAALGTAIHKALERFYQRFMAGEVVPAGQLTEFFEESLKEEIMDRNDYDDTLKEGKRILVEYYGHYAESLVKPIALEFRMKRIPFEDIHLGGAIDKIEPLGEGGVKVVDYKTMQPKSRNDIMGLTGKSNGNIHRQLVFYKLLSMLNADFPYNIVEAEVDFVKQKDGKFRKESFAISEKDVENLKKLIRETVKKIRNLDFEPKRDFQKCQFCDLQELCRKDSK